MNVVNHEHLKRFHEQFSVGHDEQRDALLKQLRAEPPSGARSAGTRRRWILPVAFSGVAASVIAALLLALLLPKSAAITWGAVAERLGSVRTFSCMKKQESRYADGAVAVPMTTTIEYMRVPNQVRTEKASRSSGAPTPADALISLVNANGHPHTVLNVDGDTARVISDITFGAASGTIRPGLAQWLARLRTMDGKRMVRKGEEIASGRRLVRFEGPSALLDSTMPHGKLTIWVDPDTHLPVRLLAKAPAPFVGRAQNMTIELSDMRFDPRLRNRLFDWPEFGKTAHRIEQSVFVHVPWRIPLGKLKLTISAPDGAVLADAADLRASKHTLTDYAGRHEMLALRAQARDRVRKFTAGHAGQKIEVTIEGVGSEDISISGGFVQIYVSMPNEVPGPLPARATKPRDDRETTGRESRDSVGTSELQALKWQGVMEIINGKPCSK